MSNIGNIAKRKCGDLQGLKWGKFQNSQALGKTKALINCKCSDEIPTIKYSRIDTRKQGDLDGLIFRKMYNPLKDTNLKARNFKRINPLTTFRNKVTIIPRYSNNNKF